MSLLAVMDVLRALQKEVSCVSIKFIPYTHTRCVSSHGLCRHRGVVDATQGDAKATVKFRPNLYEHHFVSSRGLCRHRAVVDATRASRRKQPPPECLVVVGQSTSTLHAAENHRLSVEHRVLHRLHTGHLHGPWSILNVVSFRQDSVLADQHSVQRSNHICFSPTKIAVD